MVTVKPGHYVVTVWESDECQQFVVNKDKRCSCGGNAANICEHISEVADYLRSGGTRAPDGQPRVVEMDKPDRCPVCGAETKRVLLPNAVRALWDCVDDSTHYMKAMLMKKEDKIKRFLTEPHPNKIGPFYSDQVRDGKSRSQTEEEERLRKWITTRETETAS